MAKKSIYIDADAENIRLFQSSGNQQAFGNLMKKHKDKVFNFCAYYLGNTDDADDCTQEVFIKVFEKINDFRFKSKFSTWLYRIMINTCKNTKQTKHYRMKNNLRQIDGKEESLTNNSSSPEKLLINEETGTAINLAIQQLQETQKIVLMLRDIEGKSYEEIAEITGFKTGTVKSKLARARLKTAEKLKSMNSI